MQEISCSGPRESHPWNSNVEQREKDGRRMQNERQLLTWVSLCVPWLRIYREASSVGKERPEGDAEEPGAVRRPGAELSRFHRAGWFQQMGVSFPGRSLLGMLSAKGSRDHLCFLSLVGN
ncbi:Calcium Load-Activated Calcium Channel [Manis pentadactyla]|nr:Calcium Load-Activated Calcium Channel [Manis pentadactyla]